MKKWIKGVALATVIVGTPLGVAYHMGLQYKLPQYNNYVMKQNTNLPNYERELSLSLSFDNKTKSDKGKDSFSKLNGSVLVVHENKTKDGDSIDYSLTTQGQDFSGKQVYTQDGLVVKCPMYHRNITFDGTPFIKEEVVNLTSLKENVFSFLRDSSSHIHVYRDIGGNEKGVETLVIKGENQQVKTGISQLVTDLHKGFPYQSILLNNQRITNRLLKEHQSDEEVNQKFQQTTTSIADHVQSVVTHSKVTDSEISLKITDKQVVKEWSATIKFLYTNPDTKETIPFTLYIDMDTWNVGKAKIQQIQTTSTNSIPYERMTDDINYFKNENLQQEVGATEDNQHVQKGSQGIRENTSTLKDIGNFKPVLPKTK